MFSGIHNSQVSENNNYSVTPLAANAVFTGSIASTAGWETISVNVISDKAGATNGISIQFFLDALGTVSLGNFAATYNTPGTLMFFQASVHGAYYKLSYTNGAAAQTTFTLLPFLSLAGKTGTIIPISFQSIAGYAGQVVRSGSETQPGNVVPPLVQAVAGSDGTDARTLITDSTGKLILSNFPAVVDTNFGTVGTNTIRTASEVGNATGAADFNNGASTAQTVRTASNIADGAGNKLTSQTNGTQRALDVGIDVAGVQVDPRQVMQVSTTGPTALANGTITTPLGFANGIDASGYMEAMYATWGRQFTVSTNMISTGSSSETPFMLITNPTANTKIAKFRRMIFSGPGTANNIVTYRLYLNPTITTNGTALTPRGNRQTGQNAATVNSFSLPTVSANGSFMSAFLLAYGAVENYDVNYALFLEPNNSILITAQQTVNNVFEVVTLSYAEE